MALEQTLYRRFRQPVYEFTKFAVVGITGVLITSAVYDLLYLHYGPGPVLSTTIGNLARAAFVSGMDLGLLIGAAVALLVGCVIALIALPSRARER